MVLRCYGEELAVAGLQPEALSEVARFVGATWRDSEQSTLGHLLFREHEGSYRLEIDGSFAADSPSLRFLAEIVKARLIKKVAVAKSEFLFLQADVVRCPGDEVVMIVGPGISGKTRLAQAFIDRGATLWSTDVAVLNPEGDLLAFPSPELPESGVSPSAILMISYEHQGELTLEELSVGQTVLQLAAAQLLPSDNQGEIFTRTGQLATRVGARYSGRRGDSSLAAVSLSERLGF